MERLSKKKVLLMSLLAVPALLALWFDSAGARGRLQARFDLWRGHYVVHTYGLIIARVEIARLLKDRYGIETHVNALCIVSEHERAYIDSYNEISVPAANRKFGHDFFKECTQEALRRWELRREELRRKEDASKD